MNQDILTHYGKAQIPSIKIDEPDAGGIAHYRIDTKYINNMGRPVRLKLRSNMEIAIPAVMAHQTYSRDKQFIVRQELVVKPLCVEQMHKYFLHLPENDTGALKCFREAYLKVYDSQRGPFKNRELRCVVDYVFTEYELDGTNGIFYYDELDTLFKFGSEPFDVPHPHSFAGRKLASEEPISELRDKHGFVFWVEIIDNLGKYGDRYIPICNQVFKIPARTDKNRPDGLYIVSSKPTNGKIAPEEISTKYYRFEDVEKELGIYPTYEQAMSYGDVILTRKRELAEKEHAIALERQAFQQAKMRYEADLEEKNRRLREVEHERTMLTRSMDDLRTQQGALLEMERLRLRDTMDRRTSERKDASEMIKFIPTILSAVGMILMAYKAFRTGS